MGSQKLGYLGFVYPHAADAAILPVYHRYTLIHEPRLEDYRARAISGRERLISKDRHSEAQKRTPVEGICHRTMNAGGSLFLITDRERNRWTSAKWRDWLAFIQFRITSKYFLGRVFLNTFNAIEYRSIEASGLIANLLHRSSLIGPATGKICILPLHIANYSFGCFSIWSRSLRITAGSEQSSRSIGILIAWEPLTRN